MMRLAFEAALGLLVAYPALLADVLLWPRITRRVRGWAR